jgi:prepilin-type N-terminal cleavage/methylation domain-containing protein
VQPQLTSVAPTDSVPGCARRAPGGFTLLELMIVIAIAGIMMALALPAMHDVYANNHVKVVAADLAQDMAFARANAIAYSKNTIIQAKTAGTWTSGWEVYVDNDTSGTFTAGDVVLKQSTPTSGTLLICTNVAAFATNIIFRPDGTVVRVPPIGANDGITVSDTQSPSTAQASYKIRTLYIGPSGRVTNVEQNGGAPTTGVGGSAGGACP